MTSACRHERVVIHSLNNKDHIKQNASLSKRISVNPQSSLFGCGATKTIVACSGSPHNAVHFPSKYCMVVSHSGDYQLYITQIHVAQQLFWCCWNMEFKLTY